ncbi:MAG TPA: putative peptidoglycan glycosyltransferase FtsW [Candidatus Paceibacterota bacterium]|nr:putative peptidoglycan glycosyltransferase FtsW [Candidatus Paceibacterota bacterium]
MRTKKPDHILFILTLVLVIVGFAIFASAALGQVGKDSASFITIALKQLAILLAGLVIMLGIANLPYQPLKKWSPFLFLGGIILSSAVFIPGLGFMYNGATRWLDLGFLTIQPAEILKLTFIIFLAAWASARKEKIRDLPEGLIPFILFLGLVVVIMFFQKDTGTLMVMLAGAISVFIAAGGRIVHLFILGLIGIIAFGALVIVRPHVRDRLVTFLNPSHDEQGSSYQINQSLIAIGSGGLVGRGFGQSIQKFNFLPEPIGDSIFAVAGEEFGLLGSSILILLFLTFALYGYLLANKEKDSFCRLLIVGLVTLISAQAFINIGAMLGLLPLTGVPLPFVSHGGTALLFALIEVGIILSISRHHSAKV